MLSVLFRRRACDVQPDWYVQAHCLRRAGYHSAAVCIMRAAIERHLTRLALMSKDASEFRRANRRSFDAISCWLMNRGLLDKSSKRQFETFADKASRAAHGKIVGRDESLSLLREASVLQRAIHQSLQAVMTA